MLLSLRTKTIILSDVQKILDLESNGKDYTSTTNGSEPFPFLLPMLNSLYVENEYDFCVEEYYCQGLEGLSVFVKWNSGWKYKTRGEYLP